MSTVQILEDSRETGEDVAELLEHNPGAIQEIKHDALCYLMEGGHPIEQATPREGVSIGRHRRVV